MRKLYKEQRASQGERSKASKYKEYYTQRIQKIEGHYQRIMELEVQENELSASIEQLQHKDDELQKEKRDAENFRFNDRQALLAAIAARNVD